MEDPMINIQDLLKKTETQMQDAQKRTFSGPAGTRVIQSLLAILALKYLDEQKQEQVTRILNLYDDCLKTNGQVKLSQRSLEQG